MPLMTWDKTMSVSVEAFDTQHQKIINMMNNLAEAMEQGKGADAVGKTLDELLEYVLVHFESEEVYFERFIYSDTREHVLQHEFFVKKVAALKDSFDDGGTVLSGDLILFLKDWWIHHIMVTDKMYSEYFNERGLF